MLKSSSIFKKNDAHLVGKKTFEKNKDCPFLKCECFEHVKAFLICLNFWSSKICNWWKIFPKNDDNLDYYVFFVIFQTYKNAILRSVHSLGLVPLSWSKQPIVHLFQVLLLLTSIVKNVTIITSWSISFTLTYWNSSILDYLICLFVYFFIFSTPRNNIHTCEGLGRHIIALKADVEIFHVVLKPLLIVIMAPCSLKCHLTIVWIQIPHWRKNMKNYGLWISCMIFVFSFFLHTFLFLQFL